MRIGCVVCRSAARRDLSPVRRKEREKNVFLVVQEDVKRKEEIETECSKLEHAGIVSPVSSDELLSLVKREEGVRYRVVVLEERFYSVHYRQVGGYLVRRIQPGGLIIGLCRSRPAADEMEHEFHQLQSLGGPFSFVPLAGESIASLAKVLRKACHRIRLEKSLADVHDADTIQLQNCRATGYKSQGRFGGPEAIEVIDPRCEARFYTDSDAALIEFGHFLPGRGWADDDRLMDLKRPERIAWVRGDLDLCRLRPAIPA